MKTIKTLLPFPFFTTFNSCYNCIASCKIKSNPFYQTGIFRSCDKYLILRLKNTCLIDIAMVLEYLRKTKYNELSVGYIYNQMI